MAVKSALSCKDSADYFRTFKMKKRAVKASVGLETERKHFEFSGLVKV
jgi:hypothetical protein